MMEIYIIIILTLSLGFILGNRISFNFNKFSNISKAIAINTQKVNADILDFNFERSPNDFDILELRFLNQLLKTNNEEVSVHELNDILNLRNLTNENQRQRRHLFLKDLNVKLKMLYKVNDIIERKPALEDKRIKSYFINDKISKIKLKTYLNHY